MDKVQDAAVGALFTVLFEELISIFKGGLGHRLEIDSELKHLRRKLLQVHAMLINAERRYAERGVNMWLDDLRDLVYDMEDILDVVKTRGLELGQDQVRNSVLSHTSKKVKKSWSNIALKEEINEVLARLKEVVKDANAMGLRGNSSGLSGGVSQTRLRPETSPYVDESQVYGRDKDKENIIRLLFAKVSDQNKKNYSVISIVGMGGVGKTTLAQLVFNHERVKKFGMLSWACVSDVFDVSKVTKDLIEYSTNENNCSGMSLAALQKRLEKEASNKKFLLVLDDIWSGKEWDCMKAPLDHCKKGSIILVTTRDKAIATAISDMSPYELGTLDYDHSLALFKDKAFREVDANADKHLFKLGKGIVEKCKGVPLAIKVVGAMLQGASPERWKDAFENELWSLENDEIFPSLRMSYHYLPSPLKRCFEYFSLFPTNYEFVEEKLVLMWIGEGFIEAKKDKLLDIGRQYFSDLKRRCLIQKDNKIHVLVHSLACIVSEEFYCQLTSNWRSCKSLARARHVSLIGKVAETDFTALFEAKGLHTILQFELDPYDLINKLSKWRFLRVVNLCTNTQMLPSFIKDLKHMRYLDISYNKFIMDLPDAVCELYNLQYLSVKGCEALTNIPKDVGNLLNLLHLDLSQCQRISSLPQSICKLYNLRVLNLGRCRGLTQLPDAIGNLCNLMSLDLSHTEISSLPNSIVKATNLQNIHGLTMCTEMPPCFRNLTSLQELSKYPIGKETGRGIGELKDMNNLRGNLAISNLENVNNVEEAKLANLKSKKNITGLTFEWSHPLPTGADDNDSFVERKGELAVNVLEALEPHPSVLTDLSLKNYSGVRFPNWMSMKSISTLNRLVMRGLGRVSGLVDVELPSLETLEIIECPGLKDVSMFVPQLSYLTVSKCKELTKLCLLPSSKVPRPEDPRLEDEQLVLPKLLKLTVGHCSKLTTLSLLHSNSYFPLQTNVTQAETRVSIFHCDKLTDISMGPHVIELRLVSLPFLTSLCFSEASITQRAEFAGSSNRGLTVSQIEECEQPSSLAMDGPSLETLSISGCGKLESLFRKGYQPPLVDLKELRIDYSSCLVLSTFYNQLSNWTSVSKLTIIHFPHLLLEEFPPAFKFLRNLFPTCKSLAVVRCPGLVSRLPSLTSLTELHVNNCHQLVSLDSLRDLTSLTSLFVTKCDGLVSICEDGLPDMLTQLHLKNLAVLRKLPEVHTSTLWVLKIYGCPQVEARPDDQIPDSLKDLTVRECLKLKKQLEEENRRSWLDLLHN